MSVKPVPVVFFDGVHIFPGEPEGLRFSAVVLDGLHISWGRKHLLESHVPSNATVRFVARTGNQKLINDCLGKKLEILIDFGQGTTQKIFSGSVTSSDIELANLSEFGSFADAFFVTLQAACPLVELSNVMFSAQRPAETAQNRLNFLQSLLPQKFNFSLIGQGENYAPEDFSNTSVLGAIETIHEIVSLSLFYYPQTNGVATTAENTTIADHALFVVRVGTMYELSPRADAFIKFLTLRGSEAVTVRNVAIDAPVTHFTIGGKVNRAPGWVDHSYSFEFIAGRARSEYTISSTHDNQRFIYGYWRDRILKASKFRHPPVEKKFSDGFETLGEAQNELRCAPSPSSQYLVVGSKWNLAHNEPPIYTVIGGEVFYEKKTFSTKKFFAQPLVLNPQPPLAWGQINPTTSTHTLTFANIGETFTFDLIDFATKPI